MTRLYERMLPDVRLEPATVRIPGYRRYSSHTQKNTDVFFFLSFLANMKLIVERNIPLLLFTFIALYPSST